MVIRVIMSHTIPKFLNFEGSMATGDLRNGYHPLDILVSGPGDICPPMASKAFSFSASDACTWATSFWDNLRPLRHEGSVFAHVWATLARCRNWFFKHWSSFEKSCRDSKSQYIHFNPRNKDILQDFYLQSWIHILNQSMLKNKTPKLKTLAFSAAASQTPSLSWFHLQPEKISCRWEALWHKIFDEFQLGVQRLTIKIQSIGIKSLMINWWLIGGVVSNHTRWYPFFFGGGVVRVYGKKK